MGIWQWLRERMSRRAPGRFNLVIEPGYAIKASRQNAYFKGLERLARESGFLGEFVVDAEGWLRPGSQEGLPTRHARLVLDVYPNPAAIEGRGVGDYDRPTARRRVPSATLELDDGELFLSFHDGRPRVSEKGA